MNHSAICVDDHELPKMYLFVQSIYRDTTTYIIQVGFVRMV